MAGRDNNTNARDETPDEATILADIRYYEARIAALTEAHNAREIASVQVCRLLLRQRRQLLAAVRDGAPERWPEYSSEND